LGERALSDRWWRGEVGGEEDDEEVDEEEEDARSNGSSSPASPTVDAAVAPSVFCFLLLFPSTLENQDSGRRTTRNMPR